MMRKYDDEFKQQAVRKILDGQSAASLSGELDVGESQLHKWKRLKIESGSDLEKENIKLKKRNRELEMENEILKKAALIFGRGSESGISSSTRKEAIIRLVCYAG